MVDLQDAVDFHVHTGPSFFDRKADPIDLAQAYQQKGIGGAILKSHFGNTHVAAELGSERIPDVEIYSSVTLNSFVGGFNPTAVEHGIETGAKVVWMPTFSAANFDPRGVDRNFPFSNQSLRATTADGNVKPEVLKVIETIADADRRLVLGNGHLSRQETFAIIDVIQERGFDIPYLITHADFEFMGLSVEDQIELAERGAVIEKCYLPITHGDLTVESVVADIDEIGAGRCVLSTDHGQAENSSPPVAYHSFINSLLDAGLSTREFERLFANAWRLLGDE